MGLHEVTEGIYQVRGGTDFSDFSNTTLIEGDQGVIVIDPVGGVEPVAALGLYREHRGDRPVTGVIYTRVGVCGWIPGVAGGDVPILAPVGSMEQAICENVDAVDITRTGQEETVDGVRLVFQLAPGTDAPAEMNLFLPDRHALWLAENANGVVRDARIWSRCLSEAIALFGAGAKVVFASHSWPAWGNSNTVRYLSAQRDAYAYLHDQTLRMLNRGFTGAEIAELVRLPPALEKAWHARGYPGSVAHNVMSTYQRYLGWFDGNPAGLWRHPPVDTAKRYVQLVGGLGKMVAKAREFVDSGDLRFAAQQLQHAVFADPAGEVAKELLAQVYERLAQSAEGGRWRDFYLTGALMLRRPVAVTPVDLGITMAATLSIEQIFDTVAIRVDAPAAWHQNVTIDWVLEEGPYRTTLRHGVLIHCAGGGEADPADLTLRLSKAQLLGLLTGLGLEGISHEGDPDALKRLLRYLD